jgi:CheY-like chemotaxis protein
MSVEARRFEILLVEDNPGDVRLTQEALRDEPARRRLHVAADGEDGLAFLRREGRHRDAPRPDLVLLDLSLPGKPGGDVLKEIKESAELRPIPVVVFTSSSEPSDVLNTYQRCGNCFVTKPLAFDDYARTVRSIETFWLCVARLPTSA